MQLRTSSDDLQKLFQGVMFGILNGPGRQIQNPQRGRLGFRITSEWIFLRTNRIVLIAVTNILDVLLLRESLSE